MSHSSSSLFPFADYINFQPGFTAASACDDGNGENGFPGSHESTYLRLIPDIVACNSSSPVCLLFRDLRLFDSHAYNLRLIPTTCPTTNGENNAHNGVVSGVNGLHGTWPGATNRANHHSSPAVNAEPTSTSSTLIFPCQYQNKYALTCELPAHLPPGRHLVEVVDSSSSDSLYVVGSASLLVDSVSESLSRLIESSSNPLSALADALGLDVSDNATLDRHLCKLFRQNTPYEPFDRALRLSSSSSSASAPRETTRKYPSLLHLASAYGLKDLCANMVDCPGVEALQRMTNVDGATPQDLAHAAGFHELATFLASYQRNREVVDAARVTLYRKFTQAVGLYDVKSHYMLTPPHSPPDRDERRSASGNGADAPTTRSSDAAFTSPTAAAGVSKVQKPNQEESFESVFGSDGVGVDPGVVSQAGDTALGGDLNGVAACCLPSPSNGRRLNEIAIPSLPSAASSSMTIAATSQPIQRFSLTSTDDRIERSQSRCDDGLIRDGADESNCMGSNENGEDGRLHSVVIDDADDVDLSRLVVRQTSEDLGYVTMSSSRQDDSSDTPKQQRRQNQEPLPTTELLSPNRRNYVNSHPVPVTSRSHSERHSVHSPESAFHVHGSRNNDRRSFGHSFSQSMSPEDDFSNEYMKMSKVDATSTPCLLTAETILRETGGALFGISPTKPHLLEQPLPGQGSENEAGRAIDCLCDCCSVYTLKLLKWGKLYKCLIHAFHSCPHFGRFRLFLCLYAFSPILFLF